MIGRYKPPRRWSDPDLLGRDTLIRQAVNRILLSEDRIRKHQAELLARLTKTDRRRRP